LQFLERLSKKESMHPFLIVPRPTIGFAEWVFANGFMASENTGTTNELLLARWYINEMYLDINDIKNASSKEEATKSYKVIVNALNSYLGLMKRAITSKVGDKWDLVQAR
jgi:hypothetical protein